MNTWIPANPDLPCDFASIEKIRKQGCFAQCAESWIFEEINNCADGDMHLNLLAWVERHPQYVLAIVLDLIELTKNGKYDKKEQILESIALGPIEWLVTHVGDDFVPVLQEAVRRNEIFSMCTNRRNFSNDPVWSRLKLP